MPLRGLIDGVSLFAPSVGREEWDALRGAVRRGVQRAELPCCGRRAGLRRSRRGLQHFYHLPDDGEACTSAGETEQHMLLKLEIAAAVEAAGWRAETEAAGENWRADVLAIAPGGTRVAFEVQWSAQTLADTQERQERYAADDVRGCWFFRKLPPGWSAVGRRVPLFGLEPREDGGMCVSVQGLVRPMREVVEALLRGRIQWRASGRLGPVAFKPWLYPARCWACRKWHHGWRLEALETCRLVCGREVRARTADLFRTPVEIRPEAYAAMQAAFQGRVWTEQLDVRQHGRPIQVARMVQPPGGIAAWQKEHLWTVCPACTKWCNGWWKSRQGRWYHALDSGGDSGCFTEIDCVCVKWSTSALRWSYVYPHEEYRAYREEDMAKCSDLFESGHWCWPDSDHTWC